MKPAILIAAGANALPFLADMLIPVQAGADCYNAIAAVEKILPPMLRGVLDATTHVQLIEDASDALEARKRLTGRLKTAGELSQQEAETLHTARSVAALSVAALAVAYQTGRLSAAVQAKAMQVCIKFGIQEVGNYI